MYLKSVQKPGMIVKISNASNCIPIKPKYDVVIIAMVCFLYQAIVIFYLDLIVVS